MKKCILFSRVSTESQDFERQEIALKNLAKDVYGYDENNIIVISVKESAIRLNNEEREGVKRMKQEIVNDRDIDCVFCWELTRLSRQMIGLLELKDWFIEHHIQLIVQKDNIKLLEDDGKVDKKTEMWFGVLSTFASLEMDEKKERMLDGKRHKMRKNKFIGGGIAFGYRINENDEIVIDDDEADIVRYIFNEYEKGYSCKTIGEQLMKRGEIPSDSLSAAIGLIGKIVNREQYTGQVYDNTYTYPQIISKEQFDRCRKVAQNKNKPRTGIKTIYYCSKLLFSKSNGKILSPYKSLCIYRMYDIDTKENATININVMDSLTWYVVKQHRLDSSDYDAEKEQEDAKKIQRDAEKKLKNCEVRISKLNENIERTQRRILEGKTNEDFGDRMIAEYQFKIREIELEKDTYNHTITAMMNRIIYASSWFYKKEFDEPKSDKEISDIIHNDLEKVVLEKHKIRYRYWVEYFFKDGMTMKFELLRNAKSQWVKDMDGNFVEFEMLERIKRKRY